ncbi:SRPBCC family protein [Kribbella swartbergensis]
MSVTSVDKDFDALTLTVIADFDASAKRVWELWADPRLLERWWGPPTHPATVIDHDLTAGGEVTYFMTSPEGEKYHGWWRLTSVNPPTSLEFVDGFADSDGKPAENLPVNTVRVQLSAHDGGTRMELKSVFDSREQMDQLIGMGMAEGLEQSVSQIDALLAA